MFDIFGLRRFKMLTFTDFGILNRQTAKVNKVKESRNRPGVDQGFP
jgi:hypothetical protein